MAIKLTLKLDKIITTSVIINTKMYVGTYTLLYFVI